MASTAGQIEALTSVLADRLRDVLASRPWLSVGEVSQSSIGAARELLDAGADVAAAVSVLRGVGDVDDELPHISCDAEWDVSMMESIRRSSSLLRSPPSGVQEWVDRWDPEREARSVVDFTWVAGDVCGRPTFGARPAEWEALEDKLTVLDLWAGAGVPVSDFTVVDLTDPVACLAAHRRLATDLGTVWALDNDGGWHGGGSGTVWMASEAMASTRLPDLAREHRRARVMPFAEGIPCSIHGIVIGDDVVALRPMESLVFRDPDANRLVYGKASSCWDAPAEDRESMRTMVRAIGAELRRRVDFRGVFTLDGVLGSSGFVPTEVNPRFGGALPMRIPIPSGATLNLYLLNLLIVEGLLDDVDATILEDWLVGALDANRRAVAMLETERRPAEERSLRVGRSDDAIVEVGGGADAAESGGVGEALATVTWGSKGRNGLILVFATDAFPIGPSSAPLLLEIVRHVDADWGIGLPPLVAASPAR